jgi:hypothetical protein
VQQRRQGDAGAGGRLQQHVAQAALHLQVRLLRLWLHVLLH